MTATVSMRDATISRGPQILISNASFTVAPGDRLGVVGPNGVGKSTLLSALAGHVELDSGQRRLSPPSANIGLLDQERVRTDATVSDHMRARTGVTSADVELAAATDELANAADPDAAADRYDRALQRWLSIGAADFDARLGGVCADVGLHENLLGQPTRSLSGGEAARVGLAVLMMSRFDLYLLDEPTNDLDLGGLDLLERWVLQQQAGVVIVSHDRRFLERTITGVAEIDHHAHTVALFGGGWQAFVDERERARQHAVESYDQYESQRRALAARAQRQREWAQQGQAKVRRGDESDKHIRAFKVNQTEQLAGKAAQTQRAIDRLEVVDSPREPWQLRLTIAEAQRSGDVVARLTGAVVDRGDFRLGPVDELIEYGERIAIVGPNGAGKSTLIDLITGRLQPTSGTVTLGSGVVVGEVRQLRDQLTGPPTLLRAVIDATGLESVDARTLLAKFGLVGDHVTRPTASLSAGERTRAALALLMASGVNLLVLDEPTNHLDLRAIEQLEQALDTFNGTLVLVTHDRALLDRTRLTRTIQLPTVTGVQTS